MRTKQCLDEIIGHICRSLRVPVGDYGCSVLAVKCAPRLFANSCLVYEEALLRAMTALVFDCHVLYGKESSFVQN